MLWATIQTVYKAAECRAMGYSSDSASGSRVQYCWLQFRQCIRQQSAVLLVTVQKVHKAAECSTVGYSSGSA